METTRKMNQALVHGTANERGVQRWHDRGRRSNMDNDQLKKMIEA